MTTTQQGKLTDEEIEAVWTSLYPLTESNLWADMRDGTHLLKFSRAIEAEVEARTAKKMDALVKDAARYRWLKAYYNPVIKGHEHIDVVYRTYTLDADIDAAMSAHQQDTVAEKGEV